MFSLVKKPADKIKALIVEDETIIALALEEMLVEAGLQVIQVLPSGEKAIDFVRDEEKPDLILMDINLSGRLDGFDAASEIWKEFGIPCIFLTGYSLDSIKTNNLDKAQSLGILTKPIDESILKSILNKFCNRFPR